MGDICITDTSLITSRRFFPPFELDVYVRTPCAKQRNLRMKANILVASTLAAALSGANTLAAENYGPYPVTVKGYAGKKTNSVSYSGQIARHTLHNSLKKLSGRGNGSANPELKAQMMAYYAGKAAGRSIIDPATKGDFKIKQTNVDEISKKKNLKGKTYKGLIAGFPGGMTGQELGEFLIDKAASSHKGFDPITGYDYVQILSKFLMGAVFYNQAVDNYLDEKLEANNKPNNKPYKPGAYYTGKEHSWDEGFGYFGVPANAMSLSPKDVYGIAKKKSMKTADANGDGVVDLKSEMTFAHGYYAAGADKGGSNYMHTITQAFIDGRKLITAAKGEALTDAQRNQLKGYADIIKDNWAKVIAEATFKYAGSTYKDLVKLQTIVESNGDASKTYRKYAKHWGELKGFSLALQTGGKDLGETAVRLNRLIGYGPVLLGGGQVTGYDFYERVYEIGGTRDMGEYMVHMIKVQALLKDRYGLKVMKNDVTGEMAELVKSLGGKKSAEND